MSSKWDASKVGLHDHPVEPPGRRPPSKPLVYLGLTVLAVVAFLGLLWLLEAFGVA
jgi:hypothetical protein